MTETPAAPPSVPQPSPRRPAAPGTCKHFHLYGARTDAVPVAARPPASWRREHWVLASFAATLAVLVGLVVPNWAARSVTRDGTALLTTLELLPPALPQDVAAAAGCRHGACEHASGQRATMRDGLVEAARSASPRRPVRAGPDGGRAAAGPGQQPPRGFRRLHPGEMNCPAVAAPTGDWPLLRFDHATNTRAWCCVSTRASAIARRSNAALSVVRIVAGASSTARCSTPAAAGIERRYDPRVGHAFSYDIDFRQDLRVGDSFSRDLRGCSTGGRVPRDGDIPPPVRQCGQALHGSPLCRRGGQTVSYYSEDGRPLRKSPSCARRSTCAHLLRLQCRAHASHPGTMHCPPRRGLRRPSGTPIYAAGGRSAVPRPAARLRQRGGPAAQRQRDHTVMVTCRASPASRTASACAGQLIGYVA